MNTRIKPNNWNTANKLQLHPDVHFMESLDKVNLAMQGSNDLRQMMQTVLDAILSIFDCDRAWLLYPCDPDAVSWRVPVERATPEYPSVFELDVDMPMAPETAKIMRIMSTSTGPVSFGADGVHPLDPLLTDRFSIRSMLCMQLTPRIGKPWAFGLHHCRGKRQWSAEEQRLFQEGGRMLTDSLTSRLSFRGLQQSERRYREVFENSSDCIFLVDVTTEGRFKYAGFNPAQEKAVGYTNAEVCGKFIDEVMPVELAKQVAANFRRCVEATTPISYEESLGLPTGLRHFNTILIPVSGNDGRIYRIVGMACDVTEQQLINGTVQQSQDSLAEAQRIARVGSWELDLPSNMLSWSKEIFNIFEIDDSENNASYEGFLNAIHPDDRSAVNEAYNQSLENHQPYSIEHRLLMADGRIKYVHERCETHYAHDGSPLRSLGTVQDITERKSLEDELFASEQRWKLALEGAGQGVWDWDLQTGEVHYSTLYKQMLGYADAEFPGRMEEWEKRVHPDDIELLLEKHRAHFNGETPDYIAEFRMQCKDGSWKWILSRGMVTQRDAEENPLRIIGTHSDISKRRRMEEEVGQREREFRSLAENLPDNIARWDTSGRILYSNPTHQRTLGKPACDLIGKTHNEVFTDGRYDPVDEAIAGVVASGEAVKTVRQHVQNPDGGMDIHDISLVPEYDEEGNILSVLGIGRNMTDIYRMQQALAAREQEFRSLAENSPDPIYRYNRECRYLYVNAAASRVLGRPATTLIGCSLDDKTCPGPDEAGMLTAAIRQVFANGKSGTVSVDYANRTYHMLLVPERDETGRMATVLGIGRDMTDIYDMQEALAAREREFRTLAENSPDSIVRYDRECRFVYVNLRFEKWMGLHLEELKGKTPMEVPDFPEAEFFQGRVKKVLETGCADEFEHDVKRANGGWAWTLISIFPEFDVAGNVVFVEVLSRDISARRRMEENLRMAASVFDAMREGVMITDSMGIILDVNPAFTQITGYRREEVLGARPSILSSGQQDKKFYFSLWKELVKKGYWSGEIINRRKDGEIYTEYLNITSVSDNEGGEIRYVGVFTDISLSKQQERLMEFVAHHDALTSLPNRALLSERMQQAISYSSRTGAMFAILYLDLDGFKPVNDRFGHDVGDETLIEIARRLKDALRSSDTVARIGGDEFVLLLLEQENKKECEYTAHRILDSMAQPIEINDYQIALSASIGISIYPSDGADSDMLLRHADQAMYVAKRSGRNQFVFASQNINDQTKCYSRLAHELRIALTQKQISVYYQPIVEVKTRRVVKAEALARWFHPELGAVSPAEFIPVAEDAGLIQELGDQVFKQAVQFIQEWNRVSSLENTAPLKVGVNCSPRQFNSHDGLKGWVEYLYTQGISGEFLDVEITEGLLLDDSPRIIKQLNQLQSDGITISLDDFGTGFSALSYLKKFDIDYLKIDRSFVQELEHNPDDIAIVEAIISMAHRLGITVVAEGVESKEQLAILSSANCDLAQGYYLARPMPREEFLNYVDSVEEYLPPDKVGSEQALQTGVVINATKREDKKTNKDLYKK